jgi:hypothetical protein
VASHVRLAGQNHWARLAEHMPPAHSEGANRTPDWVRDQAARVGVGTAAYVERQLTGRDHIQQGVRSCLGILRLATRCCCRFFIPNDKIVSGIFMRNRPSLLGSFV